MTRTPVWVGQDVWVFIFNEDANGDPVGISDPDEADPYSDTPVINLLTFTRVSVNATHGVARRNVTGRPHKKLVRNQYEYEASASFMHKKKGSEIRTQDVFNPANRVWIYCVFFSDLRDSANKTDQHILKHAVASGFSIETEDDDIATGSASFLAEEYS